MNDRRNSVADISDRIVNTMKPSLVIEYCYGIFRYRINGGSLTPIDFRMKIIAVIITSLWILVAYLFAIMPTVKILFNKTVVAETVIFALHWITAVLHFALTNFTTLFLRAKDNQKLIEIFAKIDILLHANMNDGFYEASCGECKKIFFVFIIFCISIITVNFSLEGHINTMDILYIFIYFKTKIEIVLFCEIMFFLRHRMLLIKGYLTKFISGRKQRVSYACRKSINDTRRDKYFNFIGQVSDRNKKILDLASAFNNAGEAFKMINAIYNYIVLMMIISAFVFILTVFWFCLSLIKSNNQVIVTLLKTVFWSIAELCSIIIISYYCEKLLEVKEEINMILNNIICDEITKNMRKQTKVFIELTEIWSMDFNISDMFLVNKKLVLKFISISTSCLIVLIQISHLL
ncbi:uncharacterized protein [Battus philenor]|uniref:uncharacterized protein n=1 Tax=Battus philenor TaxID=42288 RepID=UPI0035CFC46C